MCLKSFLSCTSLLVLLALPVAAAERLAPRGEVSVKGGTDRSLLTTEFWAPLAQQSDRVLYGDIRLMGDNDDNREGNLGVGYRQIKNDAVVGVHGWIDRRRTQHNSTFHQLTFGVERLGHVIDARANVYIPLNQGRNIVTPNMGVTTPYLAGSGIYYDTNGSINETPQYGLDGELGYRLPIFQKQVDAIRVYGGGYYFFRDNTVEVPGARFRTEAQINKIVSVGARVQYDKPRGTQGFLEATLKFPFSAKRLYQESGIRSRLDESPERDVDIVTDSKVTDTGLRKPVINTTSGTQQRVLYVDNSNTQSGDGTKENPFNTLSAAQNALQDNDVLYINRGDGTTKGMNQGITISKPGVFIIGSGSNFVYDGGRFTGSTPNQQPGPGTVLAAATQAPVITNVQTSIDDYTGNGILISARDISISGVNVSGTTGMGIAGLVDQSNNFNNLTIDNVNTSNNQRYGMLILAGKNTGGSYNNVTLSNLTINNNAQYGLVVQVETLGSINNVTANNLTVNNNSIDGIVALGSGTYSIIKQATFNNITANGNRRGFSIRAQTGSIINGFTVENTIANNNTQYGMQASSNNALIANINVSNLIANNNAANDGIQLYATNNGIFNNINYSNVTANGNIQYGMQLNADNGTISNVNITNLTANNNSNGLGMVSNFVNSTLNKIAVSSLTAKNNSQSGLLINQANSATSKVDNVTIAYSNLMNNNVYGANLTKQNATSVFNVDLGGGAFNSAGYNRISGNTTSDIRLNYTGGGAVFAKNNWWGNVAGLQPGRRTLSASTTVDSTSFLTTDPRP